MSLGYMSPGPFCSGAELEAEQKYLARAAARQAEKESQIARYAEAVEEAKNGNGFCSLAKMESLPFTGGWMPSHLSLKSAEKSAFDFNVLMRRREVAAVLLAQGEDERYCAAWEAHGYVSRSNVAGTRKAYDEFNEKAQEVLDNFEVTRLPEEESPEKVYTLANLASLCNKKKQK